MKRISRDPDLSLDLNPCMDVMDRAYLSSGCLHAGCTMFLVDGQKSGKKRSYRKYTPHRNQVSRYVPILKTLLWIANNRQNVPAWRPSGDLVGPPV